jgi:hypothetical protein
MKTPITDYLKEFFASRDRHVTGNPRHVTAAKIVLARVRVMELETIKKLNETADNLLQRRERERLRQQKVRAKKRHVTALNRPLYTDSKLNEGTLNEERKNYLIESHSAPAKPRRSKGTALPPSWTPNEKHFTLAAELGFDGRFVERCANEMREWCTENAHRAITKKTNWDSAFRRWLEREAERKPRNGMRRVNGPSLGDIARGQFDFGDQR